jgi:hypothetical protein
MPHILGTVKAIYDNRLRDGKPNKYPNFKIIVDDVEATLWSAITPVCKKGDKVSMHYGISKKNGSAFILNDDDKKPKIQVIPESMDDPMPESEKQWLASPPEQATDFNPVQYEKADVMDKKGLTIWIQGLLQSGIKSNQIKITDPKGLELVTTDLIDLYKKIAK